ncbi:MAG: hypothetical protein ACXAC5_01710 [Promethearchaeota archaeon]
MAKRKKKCSVVSCRRYPVAKRNFSRSPVNAHLHPVIRLGQYHHGREFRCETTVLIDCGDRFLWWHHAGHYWANTIDGYVRTPSELCLVSTCGPKNNFDVASTLFIGGRLSRKRIQEHWTTINNFFGGGWFS